MAKIEQFSPANLNEVRAAMVKAMAEVEKQFGIKVGLGKITYTGAEFSMKVSAMAINSKTEAAAEDNVDPKWVSNFMRNYLSFGLRREDLGRSLKYDGKTYTLVGARAANARLPLVVREVGTGILRTFSTSLAQRSFV